MNNGHMAEWRRLDNAAKIFPSATSKADTKVFRFSAELNEPVDRYLLQDALERTLEDFPGFCCVLKRGLIWRNLRRTFWFMRKMRRPAASSIMIPVLRFLM